MRSLGARIGHEPLTFFSSACPKRESRVRIAAVRADLFRRPRTVGATAAESGAGKAAHMHRFSSVLADVGFNPTSTGLPGAALIQQLLDWLGQVALWGSLASILVGAAIYGISQHAGNYAGGYRGKQLAAAGIVGACLAGVAPTAINALYRAASG